MKKFDNNYYMSLTISIIALLASVFNALGGWDVLWSKLGI